MHVEENPEAGTKSVGEVFPAESLVPPISHKQLPAPLFPVQSSLPSSFLSGSSSSGKHGLC